MEQYPSDNFIPQREPNEVTLEYVAEPKPYVAYYVQDRPLPGRKPETAAQEPPAKTRRKRHRGLKIFLICLAAVLVLAGGLYAAWWFGLLPDRFYGGDHGDYYDDPDYYYYYGELDESAEPELPVVSADDGVRLVYADGHGDALTIQEIYRKVNPSTVTVVTELPRGASVGTGVILTEDGYIITNAHVIAGGTSCYVALADGSIFDAALVGYDAEQDLAVIKAQDTDGRAAQGLPAAEFGDSDALSVGDPVYAIGNPLGVELRGTLTDGIVSAINRGVTVNGRSMNLIQTNAALNSGNSGGPLINSFGQVVGINTMKIGTFTDKSGVEGLGFAIPSATVKEIVNQIIQKGYVSGRPWLGLTGEGFSPFYQRFYRVPTGLYITQVDPGSPAEAVGVMPGDILVTMDGAGIASMEDLNAALYAHQVGDRMILSVYRNGLQADVEVTLTENKG